MINTTLCYIEKNNSYLMIHRTKKENDCNKDKWIGIGGKFEKAESPEECARREIKEETGLSIGQLEYRGIVTFVNDTEPECECEFMHLFWTKDILNLRENESLPECDEGELEWVLKSRMNELPHWQGDEIFLELLDKKVPFFSLKLEYKDGKLKNAVLNEKKVFG